MAADGWEEVPLSQDVNFLPKSLTPNCYGGGGAMASAVDSYYRAWSSSSALSNDHVAKIRDRAVVAAQEAVERWRGDRVVGDYCARLGDALRKGVTCERLHVCLADREVAASGHVNLHAHGWLFDGCSAQVDPPLLRYPLVGVLGGQGFGGRPACEPVQRAGDGELVPADQHIHHAAGLGDMWLIGSDSARARVDPGCSLPWAWVATVDVSPDGGGARLLLAHLTLVPSDLAEDGGPRSVAEVASEGFMGQLVLYGADVPAVEAWHEDLDDAGLTAE